MGFLTPARMALALVVCPRCHVFLGNPRCPWCCDALTTSTPAGHDVVEGPDDGVDTYAAEPEPPKSKGDSNGFEQV